MGGGLMQLVAYGAQDIYLTGNPQITFFKVVYRRHTNFAMEAIEQTFNGAAAMGQKFSCTISRNGDLLSRVYLEIDVANAASLNTAARVGHQMIDHAEVEIGGQCIDKHYGEWLDIWAQLSSTGEEWAKLDRVVGGSLAAGTSATKKKLYIPLQFWFCRNPGLALPLIALQYHEVKLNVQFSDFTKNNMTTCVFCDYIFLDTDERRRFAQVSHEYLIEQVQYSNALKFDNTADIDQQFELRFNHPVKELVWFNDSVDNSDELASCLLQLNGHDRFRRRMGSYFTKVQRYEHHSGSNGNGNPHVYSFALKPEEHQPSGTCNFSRIDNAVLAIKNNATTAPSGTSFHVYAINYNVLRIMSGMGGLAYSN